MFLYMSNNNTKLTEYEEPTEAELAKKYLDIFREQPYIFNLGHGITPDISPDKIKYLTNIVREY